MQEEVASSADTAALAAIAPQLARHFVEARISDKAIHYLRQAGERAVRLSAYQEGITHLTQGLAMLMNLPDTPERDQQELAFQVSLGMAWMAPVGFPAPEVNDAYNRARELCQQMGEMPQLCGVLGQLAVIDYVRAEHQRARALAELALSLAQQAGDPLLVVVGHWYLGLILFALGEYETARAHLERMIAFYDPAEHHRALVNLRGSDSGLSALSYDALCLWCLGYPEQALSRSQEALSLARELGHPYSLADVLCYAGCMFSQVCRDVGTLRDSSEALVRLSTEKDFPGWLVMAIRFQGEALAMLGQVQEGIAEMREGVAASQSKGTRCHVPGTLCSLAQAYAQAGQPEQGLATLDEALTLVEQTDERHWEAELLRVRADLLLMQGDAAGAEASLE